MDWKDIAGTVGKAAPLLGTLLGGPAGGAVGAIIASALGTGGSADEVAQALATNPEAAIKLRQIEADRQVRLQELVAAHADAELRIAAEDRKDARQMQVSVKSRVPAVLALSITGGFFGVLALMLWGVWKPTDNNALLILLGALGTSWGAVVNYYFGSSAGSARKDEIMAQQGVK